MKKEMKKIVTMLLLVFGFSAMAMAQIWIDWASWYPQKYENPCEHGGYFITDGGQRFENGVPQISGNCICPQGYAGPYCEVELPKN